MEVNKIKNVKKGDGGGNSLLFVLHSSFKMITFAAAKKGRGARVVEEARLESV